MAKRLHMHAAIAVIGILFAAISARGGTDEKIPLEIPRGYVDRVEIEQGDRIIMFGPFVGYYFTPVTKGDMSRLKYITFNERRFYTRDLPENARLFEGEAVLQHLADVNFVVPADDRINPVLFKDAPAAWIDNRPEPQDEFVHFHSCYDALGSVKTGYWLRHRALAAFTYDMGGRMGQGSVLYHEVTPGVDKDFAHIMEFDKGPALR